MKPWRWVLHDGISDFLGLGRKIKLASLLGLTTKCCPPSFDIARRLLPDTKAMLLDFPVSRTLSQINLHSLPASSIHVLPQKTNQDILATPSSLFLLPSLATLPASPCPGLPALLSTHTSSVHLSLREFLGIRHIALGLRFSLNIELNVCYDELCRARAFWVSPRLLSSCPRAYSALCVLHPSAPRRAQAPSLLSLRNDLPLSPV